MKFDLAYLRNQWWAENFHCFIMTYIQETYPEMSWQAQLNKMYNHLFFTKAVIDDSKMSNDEKQNEFIEALSHGKSKIVIVCGGRGSGKTGITLWTAEKEREVGRHKSVYYVGSPEDKDVYPSWIKFVKNLDDLPYGSLALIDEAAIKYNARKFASTENKDLTEKMVILRHQDITLIMLTQNLELIDINIRRLADIIVYKMAAEYGIKKRKGDLINKMEKEKMMIRNHLKPTNNREVMIEYLTGVSFSVFRKFENTLPTFWDDNKISKSFRSFKTKTFTKERDAQLQSNVVSAMP
jgi:hypothetical protein